MFFIVFYRLFICVLPIEIQLLPIEIQLLPIEIQLLPIEIQLLPIEIQLSREYGWDPINWFNPPLFGAFSKAGSVFSMSHIMVCFMSNEFKFERRSLVLLILIQLLTIAG